jgi:flagellar basal body rod protein FlgF
MKFRQNLEAVFLAAAVLGACASYATAKERAIEVAQTGTVSAVAADANMPVVVIKGQRLSAAEKAALR